MVEKEKFEPKAPPKPKAPATCQFCHTVTDDGSNACDAHKEPASD